MPCHQSNIRRGGHFTVAAHAIVLLTMLAACGERAVDGAPDASVLARVGDDVISVNDLERAIDGASRQEQFEYVDPRQVRALLETLIDRKLMAVRARAAGVTVADRLAGLPEDLRDDPYRVEQMLAQAWLDSYTAATSPPTPAEIEAYYDLHAADFIVPERVRVTRVVAPEEMAVRRAAEQLARGLTATEIAGQAGAGVNAGTVWLQQRGAQGPMERYAFSLETGDVSEAFRVAAGFAVLRVDERAVEHVRPLDEVRTGIAARLEQERRLAILNSLRAELRNGVDIAIDEQALAGYAWKE